MANTSLFGPIKDRNITFLVDTSGSMYFTLPTVKDNLIESLLELSEYTDSHFNVIEFNRKVKPWADRSVQCNSHSVAAASRWIKSLEASTGNHLVEAILMGFDDPSCDALYIISNSLPLERQEDVIDSALIASKGRPISCIFLSSTLSDPAGEDLMYDLAWETKGSFKIVEVSENGKFQRSNLVFDNERRNIRANGKSYPRDKYCSLWVDEALEVPCSLEDLPWGSYSRYALSEERIPFQVIEETPLVRYHVGRSMIKPQGDSGLCGPWIPGSGVVLVNKKVLARRMDDGFYYLGRVKSQVGRDRFLIQYDELNKGKFRDTTFQEVWIYDIISFVDAFRHPIVPGDKVLVPTEMGKYGPAVVLQGHEQRSDINSVVDRRLIVNHIDGRTESLDPGLAIWIPNKLYDRISYELRLPLAARKCLDAPTGFAEPPETCESTCQARIKEEEISCQYQDFDEEIEYEEVLMDSENPYNRSVCDYYESIYPQMPWWWKMWYQRYPLRKSVRPTPRVIRRTKVFRPVEKYRREVLIPAKPIDVCAAEYYDLPEDEDREGAEESIAASAYFRRIREAEIADYEDEEYGKILLNRKATSPVRLSYTEENSTQTKAGRLSPPKSADPRSVRNEDRPPWRYWKIEEPPSDFVTAKISSASKSPSRQEFIQDQIQRAVEKSNVQRWYEAPSVPRTTSSAKERSVGYLKVDSFEKRRNENPYYAPMHTIEFVDYVAKDRATAERNEQTEPPLRFCRRGHVKPTAKPVLREPAHSEYQVYGTHIQLPDETPAAGMPQLGRVFHKDRQRSRKARHLQRLDFEKEREQQHRDKNQRSMDARASYNASVRTWFSEKEESNFEKEQRRLAALQGKKATLQHRNPMQLQTAPPAPTTAGSGSVPVQAQSATSAAATATAATSAAASGNNLASTAQAAPDNTPTATATGAPEPSQN